MSRKSQARGEETRTLIVNAAVELIGLVGISELNHRSIAKKASVSLARTTYYFDSRESIIAAAQARMAEQDAKRFEKFLSSESLPQETRDSVFGALQKLFFDDIGNNRQWTIAYLELGLEAARSANAEQAFARMYAHRFDYFTKLFRCARCDKPEERARVFLAAYLGLTLQHLAAHDRLVKSRRSALITRLDNIFDLAMSLS